MSMMVWSPAPLSASSVTRVWRVSCHRPVIFAFSLMLVQTVFKLVIGRVGSFGCPAHSGDTNRPGNTRNGFGGLTLCPSLGGEFSEARSWRCCVSVCWRRDASAGSPAWVFADPTPAGRGTQITYANPRSCGPIFLKYENKRDWLRAGFNR